MNKAKLFLSLAAASGFTGLGMVLGYTLGEGIKNTPLWVGGLLIFLGAVMLGMFISASSGDKNQGKPPAPSTPDNPSIS